MSPLNLHLRVSLTEVVMFSHFFHINCKQTNLFLLLNLSQLLDLIIFVHNLKLYTEVIPTYTHLAITIVFYGIRGCSGNTKY